MERWVFESGDLPANALLGGASGPPAWASSTHYIVNQVVTNAGNTYVCITDHTSGGSFTGVGTNWVSTGISGASAAGGAVGPKYTGDTRTATIAAPVLRDFVSCQDFKLNTDPDDYNCVTAAAAVAVNTGLRLHVPGNRTFGTPLVFQNTDVNHSQFAIDIDGVTGSNSYWRWTGAASQVFITAVNLTRSTWSHIHVSYTATNMVGIDLTSTTNASFDNSDYNNFLSVQIDCTSITTASTGKAWRLGQLSPQSGTNYAQMSWFGCAVTTAFVGWTPTFVTSPSTTGWQLLGNNTLGLSWFGGGVSGAKQGWSDVADIVQLTATLSTGGAITSLPIQAPGGGAYAGVRIPAGTNLYMSNTSGATHSQNWVTTADLVAGATSISVVSQTPNFAYTTGTASVVTLGYNSNDAKFWYAQTCSWNQVDFQVSGDQAYAVHGGRFEEGMRFLDDLLGAYTLAQPGQANGASDFTIEAAIIAGYNPPDGILVSRTATGHQSIKGCSITHWSPGTWDNRMFTLGGVAGGFGVLRVTDCSIGGTGPYHTTSGAANWTVSYSGTIQTDAGGHSASRYPDSTPLNNYTAVTDPAAGNDNTQGYGPGSEWCNTSTSALYKCTNPATGAAVWARVSGAITQVFTGNGTATKPTGVSTCDVALLAGGGGGGSGARLASGTASSGGAGGGGGGYSAERFNAAEIGSTTTVVVGTGGGGAPSILVNSTNGTAGTVGTFSAFGTYVRAQPGGGGGGGSTGNSSSAAGGVGMSPGGTGTADAPGAAGNPANTTVGSPSGGAPGGGGGGGITAGAAFTAGGIGGSSFANNSQAGGAGGATDGAAGGNGTPHADANLVIAGSGGGGGASSVLTTGGGGGQGALYGAGGGGGGASLNGNGSGAGGSGGGGIVVVIWR